MRILRFCGFLQKSATVLVMPLLGACSTIVGAEFDGLRERSPSDGGDGGVANDASSGGVASKGSTLPVSGDSGGVDVRAGRGGQGGEGLVPHSGGTPGAAGTETDSGGANGAGASSGGAGGSGGVHETLGLVINEVKGHGPKEDFIEILNRDPTPTNLNGYSVSDEAHAFTFPDEELAGHGYVLLLLGDTLVPGEATCFMPNPCFHETWGVSALGETISLRDPEGKLVDTTRFPGESALGATNNTNTWGRWPGGTGEFAATAPTPESENKLP